MSEAVTKRESRPVIIWFILFFVALGAMAVLVDTLEIDDPVIANAMMLVPVAFMVKAGLNAARNAQQSGTRGTPQAAYLRRMVAVSLLYLASLFGATMLIEDGDPITPLSVIIAIVPGIAVAGYFWAIARLIIELKDEFLRMLQVRMALIATGFALSLASIWGFLESFGQVPHIDAYWWPIAWFFGIGIGAIVNKMTYGTIGECP